MIDVGNHGHVPDVELVVHDGPHLFGCKVHLGIQIVVRFYDLSCEVELVSMRFENPKSTKRF